MDPNNVAHVEEERIRHSDSHAGRYVIVWAALMALTAITWLLARYVHIPGGWGVAVALIIATVKGSLVALFFMHLYDQQGANRLVFVTSIVFVALLATLTILDNATRFPLANPPTQALQGVEPPAQPPAGH
ncbi:MAG TPA: cytochrome C oxidase subunit IV family protein [Anaeromyxobacteraceae bacterium]|nr:cytochrome C oxidase subunit IV family protein [Anaeromyxobacteraceae bacterium]